MEAAHISGGLLQRGGASDLVYQSVCVTRRTREEVHRYESMGVCESEKRKEE